ncbi:MAG: hypothetical protein AB7T06_24615 [Kofleriaceae bacterium]
MTEAIRVGEQDTTNTISCGYSHAPGYPRCGAQPTTHVMTMGPAGEPCTLFACPAHVEIALLLGADSHPLAESCGVAVRWMWGADDDALSHCEPFA